MIVIISMGSKDFDFECFLGKCCSVMVFDNVNIVYGGIVIVLKILSLNDCFFLGNEFVIFSLLVK